MKNEGKPGYIIYYRPTGVVYTYTYNIFLPDYSCIYI